MKHLFFVYQKVLFAFLLLTFAFSEVSAQHAVAVSFLPEIDALHESGQQPEQITLRTVLRQLEEKHTVNFGYSDQAVEGKFVDSNIVQSEVLEKSLQQLLKPFSLEYKKIDDSFYIILVKEEASKVPPKLKRTGNSLQESSMHPIRNLSSFTNFQHQILDKTLTGQVTDMENNQTLPGVSVLAKGSTTGTVTDIDGKYRMTVSDEVTTLVFSSVGYATEEVDINGRSVIDVILAPEVQALSEVVVTALGIKKEAKSLGYATSTVEPEQITVNRTPNFMDALQGKMAGVNITSLGTGPQGSSKIRIRGISSFGGDNSPLIVVNGVPIDNTNFGARGEVSERGSNRTSDSGDGLSSINPDDITSMNVLKGAAASALYASGIEANMQQFSKWPGDTDIPESEIEAYIQAHPLEEDRAIEQINTQYWVASLLNGPEAWANFRRSGYPEVDPNPYPGSDLRTEDFIRRLTYPDSELTVNKENVDQATNRQGPDVLDTRVWWDVE